MIFASDLDYIFIVELENIKSFDKNHKKHEIGFSYFFV